MYNWALRDAHMAMILTYSTVAHSAAIYYSWAVHSDSSVYAGGTIAPLMYKQKGVDLGDYSGLREYHGEMVLKLLAVVKFIALTIVASRKWSMNCDWRGRRGASAYVCATRSQVVYRLSGLHTCLTQRKASYIDAKLMLATMYDAQY